MLRTQLRRKSKIKASEWKLLKLTLVNGKGEHLLSMQQPKTNSYQRRTYLGKLKEVVDLSSFEKGARESPNLNMSPASTISCSIK